MSPILHYLDDFLIMGPPLSPTCSAHPTTIMEVCSQLGIPLALEKLEGPTQSLTFLGITLDTHRMESPLPPDKLQCIRDQVAAWLAKKCNKTGYFISRGAFAACYKSSKAR